ncbi:hypothetical protein TUM4644_34580 [Shewanella colwelliana]|uniref:thioredoxin domain-containing protein n=1 Tax=Shewanella colwelliana TaxID=23 RepID=UPI001BC2F167|nr:DUF255 domain-containing protein [Shewanella colwelliana]GIU33675.1 hypothetical protein TUM4644_34580 [Shewanella colwelliana]
MRFILFIIALLSGGASANDFDSVFESRKSWFDERGLLDNAYQANGKPQYINALIDADSPYLLSHALQPVDWVQWQPRFEHDFASGNKLIFISIGYETCHWCHVMAQESFNSEAVAAVLNQHFVSIKVDREQWPLVDNRYKLALELLKGEAGWPINVVLTPQGKVLWADSYLPASQFTKVINALSQRWQTNPNALQTVAAGISARLEAPFSSTTSNDLDPHIVITELNAKRLVALEEEASSGGPRFLREYWLLGLLEQYLDGGEQRILEVVKRHVDGILLSPTYDAVDGGFHRYAVDGNWLQPHFEKMLYTQAFMIKVLARLYLITDEIQYLAAMEQTIAWVDHSLYQSHGRSSAMSAISGGEEGSYYRFVSTDQSLLSEAGFNYYANRKPSLAALAALGIDWRNNQFHQKLVARRHQNVAPLVDEKVIVSWNAMYIDALVDAYQVTSKKQFLESAIQIADHLWAAARSNNVLYRIVFQGRPSIEATYEDYAWFASALLKLSLYETVYQSDLSKSTSFQKASESDFKARATWLLDLLSKSYRYETLKTLAQDGELPSVYSSVYKAMALGYESLGNKQYRMTAKQLIKKHSVKNDDIQDNYSFWAAIFKQTNHLSLRASYFAKGRGKVTVSRYGPDLVVELYLVPGWHVNANPSANEKLIATEIDVVSHKGFFAADYPSPTLHKLGFSQSLLKLYEGRTRIELSAKSSSSGNTKGPIKVKVRLQACSDKLCLLPEVITLVL